MSPPLGLKCIASRNARPKYIFGYQVFILIFTFIIYASYHLSRKPISVVKSVLHNNTCNGTGCGWVPFDGPNAETLLGALDLSFLSTYAVGMFLAGHIAERTNMRYFLFIGLLGSGIMTILFGLGKYWNIHMLWYFVVVQLFCGFIQASGWPPIVAIVANWFGKGSRGLIFGIWNSHTYVGNILGSLIAGVFLSESWNYNWGLSFIVPGLITVVMSFLVLLFLIPHPRDLGINVTDSSIQQVCTSQVNNLPDIANGQDSPGVPIVVGSDSVCESDVEAESEPLMNHVAVAQPEHAISFMRALRIPGVIEFSVSLFFAKLVSYTFLFWLPDYINHSAHLSPLVSSELSTMFDVGGIAGGIFAGVMSDFSRCSALTCVVMMLFAAPAMFVYQAFGRSVNLAVNIVMLLVAGALVNGPYSLITTAVSADLGTHPCLHGNAKALATVSAIIDGTGSIGAALGPQLAGAISPTGWQNVFYMLITGEFFALLFLLRLAVKEVRSLRCRPCRTCC